MVGKNTLEILKSKGSLLPFTKHLFSKKMYALDDISVQLEVKGEFEGQPVIRSGQITKDGQLRGVGLMIHVGGELKG